MPYTIQDIGNCGCLFCSTCAMTADPLSVTVVGGAAAGTYPATCYFGSPTEWATGDVAAGGTDTINVGILCSKSTIGLILNSTVAPNQCSTGFPGGRCIQLATSSCSPFMLNFTSCGCEIMSTLGISAFIISL